jgi:hypothetical protein
MSQIYNVQIGDKMLVNESEIEKLRTRIADLETALFDALSGLRYVRAVYPEVSGVGFDRCEGYQSLVSEYRK